MESMSIGEVASRAGVRPSALRYYEGVGLLPPPRSGRTGAGATTARCCARCSTGWRSSGLPS